jgi:hypothetical protein
MLLGFARRQYGLSTYPYERPLWSRRLSIPKLGADVFVELLPTLVLRVLDRETGQVLAQSMPGEFGISDHQNRRAAAVYQDWLSARNLPSTEAAARLGDIELSAD